jgi:coenzyme F420-dependent glucose-6-phosphate dehydrogenase
MTEIGYTLSSEEHGPAELVRYAQLAEEAGFSFAVASDHFHPWTDKQGNSPFVWSVLGGCAATTQHIGFGTGVTCPTIRMHPAIVAHAAATVAAMMPGRFFLGVGSGENLNEHITGARWPHTPVRLEMLEESIEVIRKLWSGEDTWHHGKHYTVENARIYTIPPQPPPIYVAAKGEEATELAGRAGDGLIAVAPSKETVEHFEESGGRGKPKYGQVHVCWAPSEEQGVKTAYELWPNAAIGGELGSELPLPRHYEQAARTVRPEDVAKEVACGPDAEKLRVAVQEYIDAGFDHVWVHQIGPRQEEFIRFFAEDVLPKVA